MKLPRISLGTGRDTRNIQSAKKRGIRSAVRSRRLARSLARLCGCIRLCNEFFRTVNCVKQLPSIYGCRRHGGRNDHVGFGFRAGVINSFVASVYIHSARARPGRSVDGRTDERTVGRTDGRSVGRLVGWSIAAADMNVFAILQYRRPEWVKLASPCHLRAYGNICKNSKSN